MLTLQGAVAHSEMPLDTGPTLYLPYSQLYEPGYLAWPLPEFAACARSDPSTEGTNSSNVSATPIAKAPDRDRIPERVAVYGVGPKPPDLRTLASLRPCG